MIIFWPYYGLRYLYYITNTMLSIIYSVRHKACCELTFLSDYRIKSRDDLKLHSDIKPLKMHCRKCYLEAKATHFELWEPERLGMKKTIEETPINLLNEVCDLLTKEFQFCNIPQSNLPD